MTGCHNLFPVNLTGPLLFAIFPILHRQTDVMCRKLCLITYLLKVCHYDGCMDDMQFPDVRSHSNVPLCMYVLTIHFSVHAVLFLLEKFVALNLKQLP